MNYNEVQPILTRLTNFTGEHVQPKPCCTCKQLGLPIHQQCQLANVGDTKMVVTLKGTRIISHAQH